MSFAEPSRRAVPRPAGARRRVFCTLTSPVGPVGPVGPVWPAGPVAHLRQLLHVTSRVGPVAQAGPVAPFPDPEIES